MVNKKGWLRILEAVTSILIILAVMLFFQTNKQKVDKGKDFKEIQDKIMQEIAEAKRGYVLKYTSGKPTELENIVKGNLPSNFGFNIRICKLGDNCEMIDKESIKKSSGKSLFVKERIISSNLTKYNPKIVRLFVWEKDAV